MHLEGVNRSIEGRQPGRKWSAGEMKKCTFSLNFQSDIKQIWM